MTKQQLCEALAGRLVDESTHEELTTVAYDYFCQTLELLDMKSILDLVEVKAPDLL